MFLSKNTIFWNVYMSFTQFPIPSSRKSYEWKLYFICFIIAFVSSDGVVFQFNYITCKTYKWRSNNTLKTLSMSNPKWEWRHFLIYRKEATDACWCSYTSIRLQFLHNFKHFHEEDHHHYNMFWVREEEENATNDRSNIICNWKELYRDPLIEFCLLTSFQSISH